MPIKTAVITGAASGIGLGISRLLAARGYRVILADIELERAEQEAAAISAEGGDVSALFADHADRASLDNLADTAFNRFGSIDLVIANAGVGAGGPLFTTPKHNIDWVLAVNLVGPINAAQAFVPRMVAQGTAARFALTASEHGVGLPNRGGQASIYTVSKHGVLGVAETLRRDLAETKVAVSVICPGLVITDIWNPLRTRHERYGGPRQVNEIHRPAPDAGLSIEIAAQRIVAAIDAGEFYIFTHGADIAEVHRSRSSEIEDALTRFSARYGADA
jgi:NAD(P)-dependent dehydrogenase (short-subunit alcohol dehydrogenase family)